jgi:Family of unknown function (DUF6152)
MKLFRTVSWCFEASFIIRIIRIFEGPLHSGAGFFTFPTKYASIPKGIDMKNRFALALVLATSAIAAVPAYAHHSFAAEFDGNKPTRLVGKITRVEWTNPHSYFYVDVTDAKGTTSNWGCEGAGPGALSRRGWKKGDLKIGDTIVVDGYRAKDGSHLVDARRVTFPDGRTVYGGSPGDGGPGDNGTDQGALPAKAAK